MRQVAQQRTRALTIPEPNVALFLVWVSCLPTALGCQFWGAENSVCRRFLGSSANRVIYAPSIMMTEQNCSLSNGSAENVAGLEFWSERKHSLADIWRSSPAFNAFRGTDWMKEPCASCPRRLEDFGGCRCQALALTGDARAADPVCHLLSHHALVADPAEQRDDAPYISTGASRLTAPQRRTLRRRADGTARCSRVPAALECP
jgi:hypothetical protein